MIRNWAVILGIGLSAGGLLADSVTLTDGRMYSGSIRHSGDDVVITQADGTVVTVAQSDVAKVSLTSNATPAQIAEAEWTRLGPAIRRATTVDQILSNIDSFLERYGDQPIAAEVKKVRDQYIKARDEHYVKLGSRWVSPGEAEQIRTQSGKATQEALKLYRDGRAGEAVTKAKEALALDDQNVQALNIRGLALLRMNQPGQARPVFMQAAEADPTNLLALNNLAVVLFSMNRDTEATFYYGKALTLAPENRMLLDNIVEALNSYDASKGLPAYADLLKRSAVAEQRLASLMAQKGLYRYGSSWVSQEQHDRLAKNLQALKDAIAQVDANYKAAILAINSALKEIKDVDRAYDVNYFDYVNTTNWIAAAASSGQPILSDWIRIRDFAWAECNRLAARRTQLVDQLNQNRATLIQLKPESERLKKSLDTAMSYQYSGIQRVMEIGDVENPPPPAAVDVPPVLDAPANVPAGAANPPQAQVPAQVPMSLPPPVITVPQRRFYSDRMVVVVPVKSAAQVPTIVVPPETPVKKLKPLPTTQPAGGPKTVTH